MDLQLAGRRAVVTGGSRGIGRAIARMLVLEGVDTIVCSRSEVKAREVAVELGSLGTARVEPGVVELTSEESIKAMVDSAAQQLGGVDIVVNSGAMVSGYLPEDFEHISDTLVLTAFEEKLIGSLRVCRHAVPHMRKGGWGRIISIGGHTSRRSGSIAAGARNAALVNLTKNLGDALGKDGITANVVHPATTITETLRERMDQIASRRGTGVDEYLAQLSTENAIGRLVDAEEVAAVVTFLASPLAAGITGEVIPVTGGAGKSVYY